LEQTTFSIESINVFKKKALVWAQSFSVFCALDSNEYEQDPYAQFEFLLAVDALDTFSATSNSFDQLDAYRQQKASFLFGYLGYDLKNEIEDLHTAHIDAFDFSNMYFFEPRYILQIDKKNKLSINRNYPEAFAIYEMIQSMPLDIPTVKNTIELQSKITHKEYLEIIERIKQHIIEGDIYELNFCRELYATEIEINPLAIYLQLNDTAKAPFSSFFKIQDQYILCASPERFLQKKGNQLLSQPIKGTVKRGDSMEEDAFLQSELYHSEKERAENIMIVDLVRNDLTHFAETGSVHVKELFGIYTFNTVHHMISSITATLKDSTKYVQAIKKAFPMGSMTGAPKVRAMQLIDTYEKSKRGIFSGSIGYFTPENDFDFNVVIRTILYHQKNKYLSIQSGGAITHDSIPEAEWNELNLKSAVIEKILKGKTHE